jgi:hypothetical protein
VGRRAPGGPRPADRCAVGEARRAAGGVEVGGHLDRDARAPRIDDGDVVADRDQQDVGEAAAEHHTGRAVRRAVAQLHLAVERDRARGGSVGQAGQQLGLHVGRRGGGQRGAGDDGRHEGAGGQRGAELLHDHDELG